MSASMSDGQATRPTCALCGEPMPQGEEMFKYHGYSGPCPAPARPKPLVVVSLHIVHREDLAGDLWIECRLGGETYDTIGPFSSTAERRRASDDLVNMLRAVRLQ